MSKKLEHKGKNRGKKAINISQTLVVRPPMRQSIGIGKLQSAISAADRGRRERLYDIYNELLRDPVLASAIERRILAVTNTDIVFQRNDKEVDEMTTLIGTHEFEETLTEIISTKIFGKTVLELDFTQGFTCHTIPREHLNTATKEILANISDTSGYPYENDDFLLNLGKDKDLGLLLRVAPFAIFKREGFSDFAEFAELFGIDTLVGLYDPEDENGRQEMEDSFRKRGSGGSMTMSKNSDVKTIGTQSPGTVDIHDRLLDRCDEQILIGILGQTMTTKNGSSLSQSKTHAQTEDDINQSDRRYVQRILNQKLLPILAKRGFPVAGGKFIFSEKGENLSKEQELDIALKVDQQTACGVDDGYFFKKFGLPKGNKETKLNGPGTEINDDDDDEIIEDKVLEDPKAKNNKEKKKNKVKVAKQKEPKTKTIKAKELSLFKRIRSFFD